MAKTSKDMAAAGVPIIKWGHDTKLIDTIWLWKPMIPFGTVTLVEGDGGDGKTTMILTIAAMISRGTLPPTMSKGKLLPPESCQPLTTFYLTNEDEVSDTSLKRFIRAGGDVHRFAYSAELQHHMTLNEKELTVAIEQTGCSLLIVDPFQAFLPPGASLGSIAKMRPIFTMLANVAKKTGIAIVLIGHLNKSIYSKDIHRGFGSADIGAAIRTVLMVGVDKNDREKRWVRAIKSNFDESDLSPVRLVLDRERRLSFAEFDEGEPDSNSSPASTKKDASAAFLQDLLKDGPVQVQTIKQLTTKRGIGFRTVQRAGNRIGVIQECKDGIYTWRLP